jgi:hypothetical protein
MEAGLPVPRCIGLVGRNPRDFGLNGEKTTARSPWLQGWTNWSVGDLAREGFGQCLGACPGIFTPGGFTGRNPRDW